jgi:hypothetical protein
MSTEFHSEHQKGIDHLEDLDVNGRIMLKRILKRDMSLWTGSPIPEECAVVRYCEHDNETWGSTEAGKFLDQLSDYQFLRKDSASWKFDLNTYICVMYRLLYSKLF